ncbi:putative tail fiber protein [Burkholderia phage FLC6]|nr:putative tail fiber protein [Burkholderia phage FLC6]
MTDSTNVVGKTILQLDPLTGQIDLANSYIEVHVVGQTSSQKVPLSGVAANGKSAYQVAQDAGYAGTQAQWLASLVGANGKSAYQSALDQGFVGTEAAWVASLKGATGTAGAAGATGAAGADGKTIIATSGAPAAGVGNNGDLAFDAATSTIYGPKSAGAWPAGVVLKGAKGDTGNTGAAGTNGNTLITTSGAPAAGVGQNGDYAYDPGTFTFYGPKAGGAWPAGAVIKGPKGDTGAAGAAGATGNSAYQDAVAQGRRCWCDG